MARHIMAGKSALLVSCRPQCWHHDAVGIKVMLPPDLRSAKLNTRNLGRTPGLLPARADVRP
jgi:hypothetical protein